MSSSLSPAQVSRLQSFREQIDALDAELADVLARRFEVVRQVGAFKAREGIEVVQSERAQFVIDRAERTARERGIDPGFMRRVYEMMIDVAHEMEHAIADKAS